jgi:membrane protein DedA with SNARE-associated domain
MDLTSIDLRQLCATYGYGAILVGIFFEGKTIVIVAGILAHRRSYPLCMCWPAGALYGASAPKLKAP